MAVTGAELQFHGMGGQTGRLGVRAGIGKPRCLGSEKPFLGRANETVITPLPDSLAGGGSRYGIQETRGLGRDGKERGQARAGTTVHLTDKRTRTRTHTYASIHTGIHTQNSLWHVVPQSPRVSKLMRQQNHMNQGSSPRRVALAF